MDFLDPIDLKPQPRPSASRAQEFRETFRALMKLVQEHNITIVTGRRPHMYQDDELGVALHAVPARVQFRFPRSKKTRIRRKWEKNPAHWRELKPKVLVLKSRNPENVPYFCPDLHASSVTLYPMNRLAKQIQST